MGMCLRVSCEIMTSSRRYSDLPPLTALHIFRRQKPLVLRKNIFHGCVTLKTTNIPCIPLLLIPGLLRLHIFVTIVKLNNIETVSSNVGYKTTMKCSIILYPFLNCARLRLVYAHFELSTKPFYRYEALPHLFTSNELRSPSLCV